MAGIKELRLRIKALKNTSKITAAMKMVSAAKLKKAQDAHVRSKPYAERIDEIARRVLGSMNVPHHPLAHSRDVRKIRYIIISSDRGLAGGFNNNLFKAFLRRPADHDGVEVLGLGRRARDFFARLPVVSAVPSSDSNAPDYSNAAAVARHVVGDYLDGKCDKVVLVYNSYKSALSQVPVFVQLLPFVPDAKVSRDSYTVEPDEETLFAELLPKWITSQVFRAMLENAVGEHSARMMAMDNATKNTKELIGSLTLTMNRARQAAITRELIEIVSGAEALKN